MAAGVGEIMQAALTLRDDGDAHLGLPSGGKGAEFFAAIDWYDERQTRLGEPMPKGE